VVAVEIRLLHHDSELEKQDFGAGVLVSDVFRLECRAHR
jgi:hypothetical protein